MARARNIKPGFFKNETLVELPFEHRLLFVGLWTLADREGRLEDRPKRIKMELFPADNVDVEKGLALLEQHGFIKRYSAAGCDVVQVINFAKHQSPHHTEKASDLPDINGEITVKPRKQDGGNPPDSLNPDSLIPDSLNPENKSGSVEPDAGKPAPSRSQPLVTLQGYIDRRKAEGNKPIPKDHAVFVYADSAGIPQEFLTLAWHEFKSRYTSSPDDRKRYRDWPGVFLKAVKGNWLKVWYLDGGTYKLTTVGQQAEIARGGNVH